ncbi:hypothetical protein MRB53_020645 [Persea americana]|uniref:Uncharacterized protein n=1 Tax=Persea americana TaxID=3435 RepID=A0ACC2L250_PERAE|nr:hypothetical protein MRB53_020645 [Persea americana]
MALRYGGIPMQTMSSHIHCAEMTKKGCSNEVQRPHLPPLLAQHRRLALLLLSISPRSSAPPRATPRSTVVKRHTRHGHFRQSKFQRLLEGKKDLRIGRCR